MGDCSICMEIQGDLKTLNCSHVLCKKCYIRLDKQICPFCREPFIYSQEELNLRTQLGIDYSNWSPPQELVNPFFNQSNQAQRAPTYYNEEFNFNIPYSRVRRNQKRRRRRNLTFEEVLKRRRRIKKKCKMKWNKKNRRLAKINGTLW